MLVGKEQREDMKTPAAATCARKGGAQGSALGRGYLLVRGRR